MAERAAPPPAADAEPSAKRQRQGEPARRFSVLITVKLPETLHAYLKEMTLRAHGVGVVLDVASWEKEAPMPPERLHCMLQANDYHGLVCGMHDTVDEKTMELAPSLRVVSTVSYRFDHVDVRACASRGVLVGNTSTVPGTAADMIVALMLAAARRLPEAVDSVRQGAFEGWNPMWLCGKDVHGAVVGLVGLGDVSETLVRRLRGFDCRVLCATLGAEREARARELGLECVELADLLAAADFVVPQCALNEQTYHLFDAGAFEAMRSDAIFVNVVYGPVCDHAALYDALAAGTIGAAAIDVVDPGPFEPTRLRELPNCILVPNLSTATRVARVQMLTTALDNLMAGLFGNDRPERAKSWLPAGKFVDVAMLSK